MNAELHTEIPENSDLDREDKMNESGKYTDTYYQETEERLAEVEEAVLDIEQNPHDKEGVNRLFRAMHTIKGSGAMCGFDDIAAFTHHVENVLEKVRRGVIPVTKELTDIILASRDQIKIMLEAAYGKDVVADAEHSACITVALKNLLAESWQGKTIDPPLSEDKEQSRTYRIQFRPGKGIFGTGTDPAFLLAELAELGECSLDGHKHSIPELKDFEPEQCYLYWNIILTTEKDMNIIRDVFIFVEDSCELRIDVIGEHTDSDVETEHKKIGEILVERRDISSEELRNALRTQKRVGEILVEHEAIDQDAVHSALIEQRHVRTISKKRQEAASVSGIRVAADKLDTLVTLVGELVITQARISQVVSSPDNTELANPVEELERLTMELRDCALNMRMIPIGISFGKFRRLVRDLSADLDKNIELITEGAETELDKTIIDRLSDPLVHLIRNSIDHGIHTPEERKDMGKPRVGKIHLSATHRGANVEIIVRDDGMGIDAELVFAQALEKGLVSEDAELSRAEIFSLLFTPGFSTAKEVSDISGRGVGLDVVRREIDSLGGTIRISSEVGRGTAFVLSMPLTLAIIDGLLVGVGPERFVLPLSMIEECAELTPEQIAKTRGRNMTPIRGELIPFIRLRDIFTMSGTNPSIEQIVIVKVDNLRVGIVADEIVGNLQTVIKPLDRLYRDAEGISGATIMGDGTVALIADISELIRCAKD